jgi:ArsR family transcriptional regulator
LGEPQVKVSKHLAYLRTRGLVVARKEANWVIYALPAKPSAELSANLACLQDCVREDPVFRHDLQRRRKLACTIAENSPACCPPRPNKRTRASTP